MMTALLLLNAVLAFTPVFILLAAFLWLDVLHLVSKTALAGLIVAGGVAAAAAYPISGQALDALPLGFSGYSRFVAPWIEEALKGVVVVWLFMANRVGYKIDAALSGLAIGAGFAVVENALYLSQAAHLNPGIWLVRGAGTAVMHCGAVAIMASLSHQMNTHELLVRAGDWKFHPMNFVPGYLLAVLLHTAFNQFPDRPLIAMAATILIVPFMVIFLFRFGAREASAFLKVERALHIADQPALEEHRWPESAAGRELRAFAESQPGRPNLAAEVIEYWRVLGQLVLSAEDRMVERANGQHKDPEAALDRQRFARLAELERAFDHATLLKLDRLLPFSRNDLWEIEELREQLHS